MSWFRRQVPLECRDFGSVISFNRPLTFDETTLLRFAWDCASKGLACPDTGWPPLPKPLPPPPQRARHIGRPVLMTEPGEPDY